MRVYALRLSQVMTLGIILIVLPFCSLDKSSVTRIGVSSSHSRLSASGALAKSDSMLRYIRGRWLGQTPHLAVMSLETAGS